tara:strand:- start:4497 stop:5543 length:1047 start_codon:yes stop_codon:yes gene_type:complete
MIGIGIIVAAIVIPTKTKNQGGGGTASDLSINYTPSFYFATPNQTGTDSFNIQTYFMSSVTKSAVSSTIVKIAVQFKKYSYPSIAVSDSFPSTVTDLTITQSVNPSTQDSKTYSVDGIEMLKFEFTTGNILQISLVVPPSEEDVPPIVCEQNKLPSYSTGDIGKLTSTYINPDGSSSTEMTQDCSQIQEFTCKSSESPTIDYNTYPGWAVITLKYSIETSTQRITEGSGYGCPGAGTQTLNYSGDGIITIVVNRAQYSTADKNWRLRQLLPFKVGDQSIPVPSYGDKLCCRTYTVYVPELEYHNTIGYMYVAYEPTDPPQLFYDSVISCSYHTQNCFSSSKKNIINNL